MSTSVLIGNLAVDFYLETAAFEGGATQARKQAKKLARDFDQIGRGFVDLGQKMAIGVTAPLAAFAVTSVRAAMESRDAIGQVDAALASMGNAAGRSSKQLADLASGLMRNSLYDDDEILRKVTANLLTFGNVAGEQFDRAQQAAVNLATRMNGDLQAAALLVGKALNDPVKGMNAMKRAGIQFTEQQQGQIKAMVAAGDAAGAQSVMLGELERQFGGAAAAARKNNPFGALQQSWAEFQETVGAHLLKVMPNITSATERVLNAFGSLSPEMQQVLIIGAGLAAAFGPLLMVIGTLVSAMSPMLGAFKLLATGGGLLTAVQGGFAGLAGALGPILPIVAAVAAAGYLIYRNWDKIAPVLEEMWAQVSTTLGPPLQELVATVSAAFSELWNGPLGKGLRGAASLLVELHVAMMQAFGPAILDTIGLVITGLTNFFKGVMQGGQAISAFLSGDFSRGFQLAFAAVNNLFGGLPAWVIGKMAELVNGVRQWIVVKLDQVWGWVTGKIDAVKQAFFGLYDAVVGHSYIPDMVDGIADQMKRLDAVMVDPARKATQSAKDAFKELADEVSPLLDRLFPAAARLNALRGDLALIDKAEAGGALTGEQAAEARRRLALEGRDSGFPAMIEDWNAPIDGLEAIQAAVLDVGKAGDVLVKKTETTKVEVVESFKQLAEGVLGSLSNLGQSIKSGGFLDIFTGVLDMLIQLGSIGVFGKKIATNINTAGNFGGARANGGPVVPGKTYLVGENGPEWFTAGAAAGRITPMNDNAGGAMVRIVPSPYFDAVVDGRAAKVAGPMAMASGQFARQAAGGDMTRRARRRIPG